MATSSLRQLHYETVMCPAPAFPNTFKDFFHTLNEDDDVIATMLEDKLIPRSDTSSESGMSRDQEKLRQYRRGMSCRHYKRRSSDHHNHSRRKQNSLPSQSTEVPIPAVSPAVNRRRSSSIAVARQPPDLHRFLQAEQTRPWSRLNTGSPPSRIHLSPNHNTSGSSPIPTSPVFGSRLHLSPGTSPSAREPTSPSPRRGHTPNFNEYQRTRSRTSSMPAVPRHRVSYLHVLINYSCMFSAYTGGSYLCHNVFNGIFCCEN